MTDHTSDAAAPGGAWKPSWLDAALLAVILGAMVWGLGGYGLYEPHEAHFAGVGREMALRHDWITPHLNGSPYLNKPPLFYWLIAASDTLFGINEFSARLPLALAGWGGVVLAWYWAGRLWGKRAGRYAAAMFVVATGWQIFCHQLMIDALLSVLNLVWTFLLWRAAQKPASRGRWAAFYIAVAAGIMAKGLIGLAFPLGLLLLFALCRRDCGIIRHCRPLLGTAVIAVLVLPWVIPLEMCNPGALRYMVVNEHIKRVFDVRWPPDYSVVKVSMLNYLGAALIWFAPWSLLLPQIGVFVAGNWRRPGSAGILPAPGCGCGQDGRAPGNNGTKAARMAALPGTADAVLLLALSVVLPVLAFLPMPSRLVYYTLPALPPLIVLAAGWWAEQERAGPKAGRLWAAACFIFAGGTLLGASFSAAWFKNFSYFNSTPEIPAFVAGQMRLFGAALTGGGLLLALRRQAWSMGYIGVLLGIAGIYMLSGFAQVDHVYSAKHLVEALQPLAGENVVWVSEGSQEIGGSAGLAFYLGKNKRGEARAVLIMEDDKRRLPPDFPMRPRYLINHEKLDKKWAGAAPVLFITDFQRDWTKDLDGPWFPQGEKYFLPVENGGNRRVYANASAAAIYGSFTKSHPQCYMNGQRGD